MFRAIGFIIILWGLATYFGDAFTSFERAAIASFDLIETAAVVSATELERQ